jgi:hypothetical protein
VSNWTANRLADKLGAVGLVVLNERALAYIALLLNEQATLVYTDKAGVVQEQAPAAISDCVVHWREGFQP